MEKYTGIVAAPKGWLGLSIFTLLCCCCVVGSVALIFSVLTESANSRGDYSKASKYSRLAIWFNITAVCIGLLSAFVFVIYILTWHGVNSPAFNS